MDCRTCWVTAPKCTLTLVIVSAAVSFGMIIACLVNFNNFNCLYFNYLSMTPSRIFEHGEVWRLWSCYLVNPSFWSIIWVSLAFFFNGISFEAMKGMGWYALIMFVCLTINSLLSTVFMAFFGKIPGINSVPYFYDQWYDYTPIGSTPALLITVIFDMRVKKTKDVLCCCFKMPSWLYCIILFIGCQLMMYPPWYGLFYNISAVIIGVACPLKLLQPSKKYMEMIQMQVDVQVQQYSGGMQPNQQVMYPQNNEQNQYQYQYQQQTSVDKSSKSNDQKKAYKGQSYKF